MVRQSPINAKTVIILGGTGTLANAILPLLLADESIRRIRLLSRGEHKQAEMEARFAGERIDFLLGDVADRDRIKIACRGCDEVYMFAAIKRVEKAEYDPGQAVRTNVLGTMSVINACIENGVKKAIYTSSDKACSPFNTYGFSKALAESLWIAGNIGSHQSRFAALRYGNVLGSQGSVVEKWKRQVGEPLTITDPAMTRFWITPKQAAHFVHYCMQVMDGGEVFIPKMKSSTIKDVADLISPVQKVIGRREGEKVHEKLVSADEMHLMREWESCYVRYPEYNLFPINRRGDKLVGREYFGSDNAERFTTEELRGML